MDVVTARAAVLGLAVLVSLGSAAQQQQQPGAVAGGDGYAAPAGAGEGTCEGACGHMGECGVLADAEACLSSCQAGQFPQAEITRTQNASCETLQAEAAAARSAGSGGGGGSGGGTYRGAGSSCVGGSQGCGGLSICCAPGGGQVGYGQAGVCQDPAICNMPRR